MELINAQQGQKVVEKNRLNQANLFTVAIR